MFLQLIIPSLTVGWAYMKVSVTYKASAMKQSRAINVPQKILRRNMRRRRTNFILYASAVVFFLSWAPLNVFTVIVNTVNIVEASNIIIDYRFSISIDIGFNIETGTDIGIGNFIRIYMGIGIGTGIVVDSAIEICMVSGQFRYAMF